MSPRLLLAGAFCLAFLAACGGGDGDVLTVYSGRSQDLVEPILEQFHDDTGIDIEVRYGDTAEMAATILEEGDNSPADVFFAQDAGALGAIDAEGRLTELPEEVLARVPDQFRSPDNDWVGISGRSRVVAYNTEALTPEDLPGSILDFTDTDWEGRVGWAPANGSFQAFVTGLRLTEGEDGARQWLEAMRDNGAVEYPNNTSIVEAVASGEVDVGFVNHYYLFQFLEEAGDGFGARNHYLAAGDAGALVNIAGAAILDTAKNRENAERLIEFLLAADAQQYFADQTFEYPLVEGIETHPELTPLAELEPPAINLADLADLEGTLELLRETGVLP
ncbi:MAG: extracellular solute-binding protein [Dehalococcoidia bacterium]|nr:extracellular solute-binding protein [Dehalococcoidia bacterium]